MCTSCPENDYICTCIHAAIITRLSFVYVHPRQLQECMYTEAAHSKHQPTHQFPKALT